MNFQKTTFLFFVSSISMLAFSMESEENFQQHDYCLSIYTEGKKIEVSEPLLKAFQLNNLKKYEEIAQIDVGENLGKNPLGSKLFELSDGKTLLHIKKDLEPSKKMFCFYMLDPTKKSIKETYRYTLHLRKIKTPLEGVRFFYAWQRQPGKLLPQLKLLLRSPKKLNDVALPDDKLIGKKTITIPEKQNT